jgi:hypothetical protein
MSNPMQPLDPAAAPPHTTPADSPSSPLFSDVTPHGQGPAPYDIQAPMEDLDGLTASAVGDTAPGSARQSDTETFLNSPAGFGELNITGGMSGGGGDDWPSDVSPGANAETPDQGMGDFTGTGTD